MLLRFILEVQELDRKFKHLRETFGPTPHACSLLISVQSIIRFLLSGQTMFSSGCPWCICLTSRIWLELISSYSTAPHHKKDQLDQRLRAESFFFLFFGRGDQLKRKLNRVGRRLFDLDFLSLDWDHSAHWPSFQTSDGRRLQASTTKESASSASEKKMTMRRLNFNAYSILQYRRKVIRKKSISSPKDCIGQHSIRCT